MIGRRSFLENISVGAIASRPFREGGRSPPSSDRTVDVREFGATGDGKTDDTAAFNRACQANIPWSEDLCYAIHVPSGRYRIDGTVYVRKGQSLFGDGHATYIDATRASGSTFILGRRNIGDHGVADPGGAPLRLSSLHAMGGSPSHGFVETDAQGFSITDLFLTAVGVGIEIVGAPGTIASDGIIRDIFIDQCLQGILISNAQNIIIGAIEIYRPKFAVTIGSDTHDIILSSLLVVYTERAALTFSGGSSDNIIVANSTFVSNAQHEEFITNVLLRMADGNVIFNGCTFRNWSGAAILQDKSGNPSIVLSGCVFDASKSARNYDWSRYSTVLSTSSSGHFYFQGCTFRHIAGPIAHLPAGKAMLRISGGSVEESEPRRLQVDRGFTGSIGVRDVAGFAPLKASGEEASTMLPLWPDAGPWKITVRLSGPENFAEEVIVHRQGSLAVTAGGWRTGSGHPLKLAIVETGDGSMLQASISTNRPQGVTFAAETA